MSDFLNALDSGIARGRALAEYRREDALRGALGQFGAGSQEARGALAQLDPVGAVRAAIPDPAATSDAARALVRGVVALPPEQRPKGYAMAVQQAQRLGLQVPPDLMEYPGDDGLQILDAMLGMPKDERSEFERLLGALPDGDREQAIRVRAGLAPRAAATNAPAGYRVNESGAYDYIPGGPADPAVIARNRAPQGNGVIVFGPDGKPTVQIGGAAGSGAMKLTEGQSKDLGFVDRGEASLVNLDKYEKALTSIGATAANAVPVVGNYLTGPAFQQAKQAGDEFLNVILRKDTGAAITLQEQQIYGEVFLPRPGDSPEVIEQKRQHRRVALDGIRKGLGPAQILANLRGGGAPASPVQLAPQPQGVPDLSALSDEELMRLIQGDQ